MGVDVGKDLTVSLRASLGLGNMVWVWMKEKT